MSWLSDLYELLTQPVSVPDVAAVRNKPDIIPHLTQKLLLMQWFTSRPWVSMVFPETVDKAQDWLDAYMAVGRNLCYVVSELGEPPTPQMLLKGHRGSYVRHSMKQTNLETLLVKEILECWYLRQFLSAKELTNAQQWLKAVECIDEQIAEHNQRYVAAQMLKHKTLFDTCEKNPLTEEQREAILHDEDHNLVVAGAGTGKTSVIKGKVAHILAERLAAPHEVFVLAYNKKAAEEIGERLEHNAQGVIVKTVHALGYKILGKTLNDKPSVSASSTDKIAMKRLLVSLQQALSDGAVLQALVGFLICYQSPFYEDQDKVNSTDLELLSSQDNHRGYAARTSDEAKEPYKMGFLYRALKGDQVKSFSECCIANYLTLNQIQYQYEKQYEYRVGGGEYRQYQPDFSLTEHSIYIEHFGVSTDGSTAPEVDSQKYHEQIIWKRNLHKLYGTDLIETYTYNTKDGRLLDIMEGELQKRGVPIHPMSGAQICTMLRIGDANGIPLLNLLHNFMSLFRESGLSIRDIQVRALMHPDRLRAIEFVKVFIPVYSAYRQHLQVNHEIDFADMVEQSIDYITSGKVRVPCRYLIVDEFQDISLLRAKLIQAIMDQNPEASLFCVGDDWQSIYRFTGSDVTIMSEFDRHFGYTKCNKLTQTFRFKDSLLDVSSAFIQKNKAQIAKDLWSEYKTGSPMIHIAYYGEGTSQRELLPRILDHIAKDNVKNVMVLGRFNKLSEIVTDCAVHQSGLTVEFSTVHKAKGLEADAVILAGMEHGKYGFPSQIEDDPLLQLAQAKPDDYPFAEERRLFYVAMTRAKEHLYLMVDSAKPSPFIKEIIELGAHQVDVMVPPVAVVPDKNMICPKCGRKLALRNGKNGPFVGCTGYQEAGCRYSRNCIPQAGAGEGK